MNSFSDSEEYFGIHRIATITLGYMFIILSTEDDSNATVEEGTVSPTAMFTTASHVIEPMMSSMDMFVKTVTITRTVEQMVTYNQAEPTASIHCESTQSARSSSSAWMPVSLFLLVVSMVLLIVVTIVTIAALYWLRRKKRISDAVPAEEGTNASGKQEAVHNVDNVLYALPSTTSKEMPQVNGSNKEGNEVPLLDIANAVYELPTYTPDQRNPAEHPMNVTPTEAKGEEGKYMELSDAIIAPSDYLCPAKTAT